MFTRSLAIGEDGVGVLHDFEALEVIVVVQAHAGADDLVHVHDAERPVALVRAQCAVIGMIDRDQRVDAGRFGRHQLGLHPARGDSPAAPSDCCSASPTAG